jgi:hypothetical protein
MSDTTNPAPQVPARGPIDMAVLGGFLGTIGSSVGPELILSPGKDLFHYTDLPGLLGILQNGDLWLTHSRYSNDDEEMAHGQRIAGKVIDDAMGQPPGMALYPEYLQHLKNLIDQPLAEGMYICCFCQKNNLLSQWRGYGANGAGVSIQFDSGGFSPWAGVDCTHGLMRFWQVTYKEETQRKILEAAVQHAWSWNPRLTPEQRAQHAADAIQFFIPTFKNADFSEESEWRLVFTPKPQCPVRPRFRPRGAMLVPYFTLRDLFPPAEGTIATLPITHMTVGPNPSKVLNVASVRMLLDGLGYGSVPVEASSTPIRT